MVSWRLRPRAGWRLSSALRGDPLRLSSAQSSSSSVSHRILPWKSAARSYRLELERAVTAVLMVMGIAVIALLPLYMQAIGDDESPDIPASAME